MQIFFALGYTCSLKHFFRCIENRIALYSPHTTYDALAGGLSDWLIAAFGKQHLFVCCLGYGSMSGVMKRVQFHVYFSH